MTKIVMIFPGGAKILKPLRVGVMKFTFIMFPFPINATYTLVNKVPVELDKKTNISITVLCMTKDIWRGRERK